MGHRIQWNTSNYKNPLANIACANCFVDFKVKVICHDLAHTYQLSLCRYLQSQKEADDTIYCMTDSITLLSLSNPGIFLTLNLLEAPSELKAIEWCSWNWSCYSSTVMAGCPKVSPLGAAFMSLQVFVSVYQPTNQVFGVCFAAPNTIS